MARQPGLLKDCALKYCVGLDSAEVARRLCHYLDGDVALDHEGYQLAAALVRFGIETEGWRDLRALARTGQGLFHLDNASRVRRGNHIGAGGNDVARLAVS